MPKQTFDIAFQGRHAVLKIEHGIMGRNVVVYLGKREMGRFSNTRELLGGKILKTPIGDISVEYRQVAPKGLSVKYDGAILEGSVDHPLRIWRSGYQMTLFLGVFNIVIGFIAMTSKSSFLTSLGAGSYSLVFGVLLLFLGLWSWRRQSSTALWIAAFIFGADGVVGALLLVAAHINPNIIGLMIRAGFVFGIVAGAQALREFEKEKEYPYEKVKNSY